MLGIRLTGVGVTLALSIAPAFAQTLPSSPAARIGRILPVESTQPVQPRGQMPDAGQVAPAVVPNFGMAQPVPVNLTPQPVVIPAQSTSLPAPRGIQTGPAISEVRDPLLSQQPQPTQQPGGALGPATPLPPGYTYPPGTVIQGTPTPTTGTPIAGTPVMVAPGTYGGGVATVPDYSDPYYGSSGALFPRVRNAISSVVRPQGRLTFEADYLMWFVKAQTTPPLVTTSSPANNGIIGQGDTRVLYGNQTVNNTLFSGGRFGFVYWVPNTQWAVDASIFFLGKNGSTFYDDSSQDPVLARPFIRGDTGQQFSELVAYPGLAIGSVAVNTATTMNGADFNLRRPIFCGCCSRLDALIGFSTVSFNESLSVTETFNRTANSLAVGNSNVIGGVVTDSFSTQNQFYGVNLGLAGELRRGRWYTSFKGEVGIGTVFQQLQINGGQTLATTSGTVIHNQGGLLALPNANIGNYSQSRYGVVPEANLTVGYYLTQNLRIGVGYNFLYMNSVLRPGDQIDTTLDPTKIPNFPLAAGVTNPSHPAAIPMKTTGVFAQGITFSLQYTW